MKTFGRDLLFKIKNAELQGEDAHSMFSPPYRPVFTYEEILARNPKFAAVNILLYLRNNEWHFPLILRTTNENDRHSGQISLPGGKRDETDRDFEHTAKRETAEEIGVEENYVRIIREMTPIYIPPSNFYVHPFISFTKKNPVFYPQETEVVEMIEFPVTSLLELHSKPEMRVLPTSHGTEVPVIVFNDYIIWGATSMILSEFSQLLKNL